jgi:hypothetical protein
VLAALLPSRRIESDGNVCAGVAFFTKHMEFHMTRYSRWLSAAVMTIAVSSAAPAASVTGWDGTWSGAWGGKSTEATSVTVAGKRVVSYEYQGVSHPVTNSKLTATRITYEDQGNAVTLTKTSNTTAHAALHSGQGDATAELTRQ